MDEPDEAGGVQETVMSPALGPGTAARFCGALGGMTCGVAVILAAGP